MTRLLALALLFCLPVLGHAQEKLDAKAHTLIVFSQDGDKFFLVLDGQKQNAQPQAHVVVPGLELGYMKGKIIFDNEKLSDINSNIQLEGVDPGWNEVTYQIKKKVKKGKATYVLNWYSARQIGGKKVAPATDPDGLTAEEMAAPTKPPITGSPGIMPSPVMAEPTSPTGKPISPTGTAVVPCEPPASTSEIRSAINAQSFREDRMAIAREILAVTCMTTDQVKGLTDLFTFEDDRLDFVKLAYPKVTDPANYWKLNSSFTFSSNKQALSEFLKENKR